MSMDADSDLENISQQVRSAFKAGLLLSYERKAPSESTLKALALLKTQTNDWIDRNGETGVALRLLALIQESLLQYASAIGTLERLNAAGLATRDDLKRLAKCRTALEDRRNQPRFDEDNY